MAYLINYHNMPFIDAFGFVRSRRPVASPNLGFCKILSRMEEELFNVRTLDIEHYEDDRFADLDMLRLCPPQPARLAAPAAGAIPEVDERSCSSARSMASILNE